MDAQSTQKTQDTKALIEAALFAAGRTLSVRELVQLSGLPEEMVRPVAQDLIHEYSMRQSGMEIRDLGEGYVMQVKACLAPKVISIAPKEIEAPLIRTLAIIAYKQPLMQSELAEIRGNKSYAHVKELERMGLISSARKGRTRLLTTTKAFADYFGLGSEKPDLVRQTMMKASKPLGVTKMYESLAARLELDFIVVNPYRPEDDDISALRDLDILVAAPGYEDRIRESYGGELIEAKVRTLSQLKDSAERICTACKGGSIEPLAAEIDSLLMQYREKARNARAVRPLTPMIEEIARDLRVSISDEGITAAPDYAGMEAAILVPTHQHYDMDILERIKQRYDALLKGVT